MGARRCARDGYCRTSRTSRGQSERRNHHVGGIGVGNTLLSRASDIGADLLVMGAYGHARVRELLLGGATRTILKSMTLPVLMAH